jgi:hypothetical protein
MSSRSGGCGRVVREETKQKEENRQDRLSNLVCKRPRRRRDCCGCEVKLSLPSSRPSVVVTCDFSARAHRRSRGCIISCLRRDSLLFTRLCPNPVRATLGDPDRAQKRTRPKEKDQGRQGNGSAHLRNERMLRCGIAAPSSAVIPSTTQQKEQKKKNMKKRGQSIDASWMGDLCQRKERELLRTRLVKGLCICNPPPSLSENEEKSRQQAAASLALFAIFSRCVGHGLDERRRGID